MSGGLTEPKPYQAENESDEVIKSQERNAGERESDAGWMRMGRGKNDTVRKRDETRRCEGARERKRQDSPRTDVYSSEEDGLLQLLNESPRNFSSNPNVALVVLEHFSFSSGTTSTTRTTARPSSTLRTFSASQVLITSFADTDAEEDEEGAEPEKASKNALLMRESKVCDARAATIACSRVGPLLFCELEEAEVAGRERGEVGGVMYEDDDEDDTDALPLINAASVLFGL